MRYWLCCWFTSTSFRFEELLGGVLTDGPGIGRNGLVDQRAGGAGTHACRDIPVRAAVTAHRLVFLQMAADDPVGTDHYTGPAADALVRVGADDAIGIPTDGAADAGIHARGILAVPADQGHLIVRGDPFYIETALGTRIFGDGAEKGFAGGVLYCTGVNTGAAPHAAVRFDEYFLGL
jgi:hypothetical protein